MTISEMKKIFAEELNIFYNNSEIDELFSIFLKKGMGFNKFQQRQFLQSELTKTDINYFREALLQLKTRKPFQQILGETEFYGLKFFVNEHVLIPRPETEELLELAMGKIKDERTKNKDLGTENEMSKKNFKILDIGTGSGIIPIVLKKYFPEAEISAIDLSEEALKMAQKNADLHSVEINFIHQDYLQDHLTAIFDVIISNPPYIGRDESEEIEDSVKSFEPTMALFSPNENALVFYEKIAKDCENYLAKNGLVFLEINQKLGTETKNLFTDVLSEVELLKDLSGNDRFVWGKKQVSGSRF